MRSKPSLRTSWTGWISNGLRPYVKNEQMIVPSGLPSGIYTFYAAAIEAGTVPPVAGLADLRPTTEHVILLDTEPVEMQ